MNIIPGFRQAVIDRIEDIPTFTRPWYLFFQNVYKSIGIILMRSSGLIRGECLISDVDITINISDTLSGYVFYVYNNGGANILIIEGTGVTLRLAGTAAVGNRTLASRGFATIVCVTDTTAVSFGAGLS